VSYRPEFEEGAVDAAGKTLVIKRPYAPERDRLKKLELTYEQHRLFIKECRRAGIEPLTTAFNLTVVPELARLGFKSIKVASYDCGSLPLLKALTEKFEEVIVSTGASEDAEIEAAAAHLKASGRRFTMLHCVTIYPTPLDAMNLARMDYLRGFTPEVGLSDHTLVSRDGVKAALAAVHLGAAAVERHFTVLPEGETRDGRVSVRKEHLAEIARFAALSRAEQRAYLDEKVPEYPSMLGSKERRLTHEERLNRAYYRGRFCNKIDGKQVYNWESSALEALCQA
jgi:N,N'-diacetyllegionaminate synthase